MDSKFTNRLINESSPYLQQHAHNPVDWFPWGEEALQKSKSLDLPILVSIGYSACHWCHVMEHESFENEEVAAYMNEHFINIKIDREERPDLDHIYMDALQALSGSGGWPLNVFLTTETKPFFGGTYFPPEKAYNRPSWKDILVFISGAWQNKREDILQQADTLLQHIQSSGKQFILNEGEKEDEKFSPDDCKIIADNILAKADYKLGGFGVAPKFPQTFTIQYLLMYGYFQKDKTSLQHGLFSLKQMLNGGIYDHLAGGMSRYSTDDEWLAPHFEKMLYDNALLVNVLCDAYQITKDDFFRNGIHKTLQFLITEMKHKEGGFYAALDADTQGIEGKYYVWDKQEIEAIIKKDSDLCCAWYNVKEGGNWERKNILHIHTDPANFAKENNISIEAFNIMWDNWNHKLWAARNKRIKPSIDDKILLGWNSLLLVAFCKSYASLSDNVYKTEAIKLFEFIVLNFKKETGGYYHTYKNGRANVDAFLDDYAGLIQACIFLQEITSDQKYIEEAKSIIMYVLENFPDEETGMFSFTQKQQQGILVRKIEVYDGAVPSGNSIMAENLLYLGMVFDKPDWVQIAQKMLQHLKHVILKYPTSFGVWASLICKQNLGTSEIVITGNNISHIVEELNSLYLPNKILQSSNTFIDYPLLKDKNFDDPAWMYLCKQNNCSLPVNDIFEFKKQLNKRIS